MINFSVANLVVGLVVIFTTIVHNLFLQDDSTGVKNIPLTIIIPFDVFVGLSSVLFLTAIAGEKTHAILRPLRHVTTATRSYVILISIVWVLTCFLSFFVLLSWCEYLIFVTTEVLLWYLYLLDWPSLSPASLTVTTIWIKIDQRNFVPRSPETIQSKKLIITLFLVTAISLISWLPFYIIFMIEHLFLDTSLSDSAIVVIRFLQYGYSLVNPITYNLKLPEFRKTLVRLLCGCALKDRPSFRFQFKSIKRF